MDDESGESMEKGDVTVIGREQSEIREMGTRFFLLPVPTADSTWLTYLAFQF